MFHVKPIDPRLLHHARATRLFLAAVVALGLVGALLVIAQAMLIAEIVVGGFEDGLTVTELRTPLLLLAAVAVGRALVAWLTELAAHRASAAVKSELRGRLLERATRLGPEWLSGLRTGSLVALATRGIDALDDYFARYLPQLGLAVVVPVAVLARIVTEDWVSAAIIVVTLPLIPLFMILIGWAASGSCCPGSPGTSWTSSPGCRPSRSSGGPRRRPPRSVRSPPTTAGPPCVPCGSPSSPRSPWSCWPPCRWPWSP